MEAMQRLRIAAFSESNMFDAITDTADRMKDIEGRKAVVLIASGRKIGGAASSLLDPGPVLAGSMISGISCSTDPIWPLLTC